MSLTHQLFLQTLREIANVEQESFDAHRMPLIAWLVDHAWSEVPAYQTRLAGIVVNQDLDLARWCEVPILRPDDIVALGVALQARALPPEAKEVDEASDQPFPLNRRSRLATVAAQCEREWFFECNGLDLAAPLAILHPGHVGPQQGQGWSITFAQSKWIVGDPQVDAGALATWLTKNGVRLLQTNATIGKRLADAWACLDTCPPIEAIIVVDPNLTPAQRAAIRAAIGVPVLHIIEQPGIGIIAASDPKGGYLVPAATSVVEVVDGDGKPVASPGVGELIVTPLYEYVVPRLRFATGTRASPEQHPKTLIGVRRLSSVGEVNE